MTEILGIGNAIVDVLCKVDDEFLRQHKLAKGSMVLIDEETARKFSALKAEKVTSGGSVSNSITTLAMLGNEASLIGKVGNDYFAEKFIEELEKTGATFANKTTKHKSNFSAISAAKNKNFFESDLEKSLDLGEDQLSAKSFILVTPDAQRTMCTFLGCASEINENDIEEMFFHNVGLFYLEGYLWDCESTISALKKAINFAKKNNSKIAFSLSDGFCVLRHRDDFLQLIENDLDLVFANEDEACRLFDLASFSPEIFRQKSLERNFFSKNKNLTIVVTRSGEGCSVFTQENFFNVAAQKIEKLVDTTGAGDAFAAGFIHGLINDFDLEKSGNFSNLLASKIIQRTGARFEENEIKDLRI